MKKYLIFLILFFILIIACRLPGVSVAAVPTSDAVATAVSNTLTAEHTTNSIQTDNFLQTATLLPDASSTSISTPSATPTITTTPVSLKATLGTPVWINHLDSGKSFGIDAGGYSDENVQIMVTNGVMQLTGMNTNGFRSWRLTSPVTKNFYLESLFTVQSCNTTDLYGVVFRAPDYSSGMGYYFGLTCAGNYSLYEWSSTGSAVLLTGSTNEIHQGTNQTNRIGIKSLENNFIFFINDKEVQSFSDSNLPGAGHFGVFVSAYSGNLVVSLDDIAYWEIQ